MADEIINIRCDSDLKEAYEAMCKERDMTMSQLIRQNMRQDVRTWSLLNGYNHLPVYRKVLANKDK